MVEIDEVRQIARLGTVEQLQALIDNFPESRTHCFDTNNAKFETLFDIVVNAQNPAQVDLLINLNVTESVAEYGLFDLWLNSHRPDEDVLQKLLELQGVFPNCEIGCRRFMINYLEPISNHDDLQHLDMLIDHGFDPVACERIGKYSAIYSAIHYGSTKVVNRLINLGCNVNERHLRRALQQHNPEVCELVIKNGGEPTIDKYDDSQLKSYLEDIAEQPEIPESLLPLLLKGVDLSARYSFYYSAETLADIACIKSNVSLLQYLHANGINLNENCVGASYTPLMHACENRQKKAVQCLLELGVDINACSRKGTALDIALKQKTFKQAITLLKKSGAKTEEESLGLVSDSSKDSIKKLIRNEEPWSILFHMRIEELDETEANAWYLFCCHCINNTSSKPSNKWRAKSNSLVSLIGKDKFLKQVLEIFPLVQLSRIIFCSESGTFKFISDTDTLLLKGFSWQCSEFPDEEVSVALRELATAMYKKIPDKGIGNAKLANACVLALSEMPEEIGLKQIIIMRSLTKYTAALKNINRVFNRLAAEKGISAEELEEISTPDFNLTDLGVYKSKIGDAEVQIAFAIGGACELSWKVNGKRRKSVPAEIRRTFPEELKALKAHQKNLKLALAAHRQRVEGMYLRNLTLSISEWRTNYLDHKLVGYLARRLIWTAKNGKAKKCFIFSNGGFIDHTGAKVTIDKNANISLWHPSESSVSDVLGWREWLVANEMTQPFKQAHREIYVLTDAERECGDHSLRFANHILRHNQFHALAQQRGWTQTRGGDWCGGQENSAFKELPIHGLSVEFVVTGVDRYGLTAGGIFEGVGTSEVRFNIHGPILLSNIDAIVFSEIMRDVDLFVGVSSVANDLDWRAQAVDYWNGQHDGNLSATAEIRRSVLESLIPKLAIADKLKLEDNHLVVTGEKSQYGIHLGSSNIMILPSNQYLCIVPSNESNSIMLPFEGDSILSLILSKAFLLVDDKNIKDPVIKNQLKAG